MASYLQSIEEYFRYLDLTNSSRVDISGRFQFFQGDAAKEVCRLDDKSVDMIVTSPPYFGVTDYIKAFRLYGLWFPEDLHLSLKKQEIGARYKRHRRSARAEYIVGLASVVSAMAPKLKKGRPMVMVLGESGRRSPYIDGFDEEVRSVGFDLIHSLDRSIPLQRALKPSIMQEQIRFYVKRGA